MFTSIFIRPILRFWLVGQTPVEEHEFEDTMMDKRDSEPWDNGIEMNAYSKDVLADK